MPESVTVRTARTYVTVVTAAVLMLLGLVCITVKQRLGTDSQLAPYLSDISSAFLASGLLSMLFKVLEEREFQRNLRHMLGVHDSIEERGLVRILPEVQAFNFAELIEDADSLAVVMNDGQRWIGNHSVALQARFSKDSTTEFFSVDPDSSFIESLARKTGGTAAELKLKIEKAWLLLEDAYEKSTKKGRLKIYKLKTFPTKTIFLTEKLLIETPYQTASGRAQIPVFAYEKNARNDSIYEFVSRDIESVRKEATVAKELPIPPGA
jgi:hypothetical protein